MNGPDHYREAERLIQAGMDNQSFEHFVAAQAHATLALAAVQAAGYSEHHNTYNGPDILVERYPLLGWSEIVEASMDVQEES